MVSGVTNHQGRLIMSVAFNKLILLARSYDLNALIIPWSSGRDIDVVLESKHLTKTLVKMFVILCGAAL